MIEFLNVTKSYRAGQPVIEDVELKIDSGELFVLIGNSGCGKTTLLKTINKLNRVDSGEVLIDGRNVDDIRLEEIPRLIGYVVQEGGLFPHLTVEENIALIMKNCGVDNKTIYEKVTELLSLVNMEPEKYRGQYPSQLSGGQRQRVGIARALAMDPGIILMDEPFSALDSFLKWKLELELSDLLADFHGPILWVSHDRGEVFRNCKKVCVMEQGQSQGMLTLRQLFHEPETEAAARLSGCKNIVEAVPAGNAVTLPRWGLTLDCGKAVPADVR